VGERERGDREGEGEGREGEGDVKPRFFKNVGASTYDLSLNAH
jgi:hypothetical protein